jgi:hypothetical protein
MPRRYRTVTVRPAQGGGLVTALSSNVPAEQHYTIKRDWRRGDATEEWQSEGRDYFCIDPNTEFLMVSGAGEAEANDVFFRTTFTNFPVANGKKFYEVHENGIIVKQMHWLVAGNTSADGSPILVPRWEIVGPVGAGYGLL